MDAREAAQSLLDARPELAEEYAESEKGVVWVEPRHFKGLPPEVQEAFLKSPDEFLRSLKSLLREITGEEMTDVLTRGWSTPRMAVLPRNLIRRREGLVPVAGIVRRVEGREAVVLTRIVFKCCDKDGCYFIEKDADPDSQYLPVITPYEAKDVVGKERGPCLSPKSWSPDLQASEYTGILQFEVEDLYEMLPFGTVPKRVPAYLHANYALDDITPGRRAVFYGEVKPLALKTRSEWAIRLKVLGWDIIDDAAANSLVENKELEAEVVKRAREEGELWLWKMRASFAYHIWGLWKVKESLLLAAVRGSLIGSGPDALRDRIHVLIVSDPGMGKGKLADWVQKVFPRTIRTVGATASGVGVTVAVVQDRRTGRWEVEPGAIPLAGDGIVIIDEFDKMKGEDVKHLYDVMERGAISVNKAGINMTITTPATIIGLANPKYSRYDPKKSLAENLNKFDTAILSRFSLIWVLKATPGPEATEEEWQEWEEEQERVSEWIVKRYRARPPLTPEEMSAFIMWARKQSPKLTPEADEVLHRFFLAMKRKMKDFEREAGVPSPIAITARQREDLIRLTTAYAKLTASSEATAKHALMAVAVMQEAFKTLYFDPLSGEVDVGSILAVPLNKELAREMFVKAAAEKIITEYESGGRKIFSAEEIVKAGMKAVPQIKDYYTEDELMKKAAYWVRNYLESKGVVATATSNRLKIIAL